MRAGTAIEMRAEMFDLLNTEPRRAERRAGTANFGTITTAFDPRVVQLALKSGLF